MKFSPIRLLVLTCLFFAAHADAKPNFPEIVKTTYSLKEGNVTKAACGLCHEQAPPALNAYGKTLKAALAKAGTHNLTAAILHSVDKEDTDGDGFTNGAELAADTLPSDPKSKPTGTPDVTSESATL